MPTDYNITAIQLPNGDKCQLPNKVKYIDISVSGSTYSLPSGTTYTSIKTLIDNGTVCILKVPDGTYSYKYYHLASATPTSTFEGPTISLCFTSCPDAEITQNLDLIQIYTNDTISHTTLSLGREVPIDIYSICNGTNDMVWNVYDGCVCFDIGTESFKEYNNGSWSTATDYPTAYTGMQLYCELEDAFYEYTDQTGIKAISKGTSTYTFSDDENSHELNIVLPKCDSFGYFVIDSNNSGPSTTGYDLFLSNAMNGGENFSGLLGTFHTFTIFNHRDSDIDFTLGNYSSGCDGDSNSGQQDCRIISGIDDTTYTFTISPWSIAEISILITRMNNDSGYNNPVFNIIVKTDSIVQ